MKAKPIIIGIAGGTGSGKTVLVHAIVERICHSCEACPERPVVSEVEPSRRSGNPDLCK